MTKQEYAAYLRSDHWREFRDRYRESSLRQICVICGSPKAALHHITYCRLGREELTDVVPVCRKHHEQIHQWLDERGRYPEETHVAIDAIRGGKDPGYR